MKNLEDELREITPKQAENLYLWDQLKFLGFITVFGAGVICGCSDIIEHFTNGTFDNFAEFYRDLCIGSTSGLGIYISIKCSRYMKKYKEEDPEAYFRIGYKCKVKDEHKV